MSNSRGQFLPPTIAFLVRTEEIKFWKWYRKKTNFRSRFHIEGQKDSPWFANSKYGHRIWFEKYLPWAVGVEKQEKNRLNHICCSILKFFGQYIDHILYKLNFETLFEILSSSRTLEILNMKAGSKIYFFASHIIFQILSLLCEPKKLFFGDKIILCCSASPIVLN